MSISISIFNNNILTNDLFPTFLGNLYPSDIICLSFTNKELFHKISKYLTKQKHWYHPSLHSFDTRNQLDYVFESLCNIYKTIELQKKGEYPLGINRSYFDVNNEWIRFYVNSHYGSDIVSVITQTLEQVIPLDYYVAWPDHTIPLQANVYGKEIADTYQHVEVLHHTLEDNIDFSNLPKDTLLILDQRFYEFGFDINLLIEKGLLFTSFLAMVVEEDCCSYCMVGCKDDCPIHGDSSLDYDHNEGTESSEDPPVVEEYDYNEGTESSEESFVVEEYDYNSHLNRPYIRKDDGTDITFRQYQTLPVVELVCPRCNNHFFDKDLGGNICCLTPDDLW